MYFILFVLQDTGKLEGLLDAWEDAGVTGITILPSIGLAQIKEKRALQEDFPLIPTLEDIVESPQNQSRTLFSIVSSDDQVNAVLQATIGVVGALDNANSGIFIVLPVSNAYGLIPPKK
jgi:nitrogen regulatory protein P-II 1